MSTETRLRRLTFSFATALAVVSAAADAADARRWTDDQLVATYRDLAASGGLEAAVLNPALPKDPPQPAFLEALAWFAAGTPTRAGTLTSPGLDTFLRTQARAYQGLLKAKVESGADNDYPRTRTWKVVQKLTLLRNEMSRPERAGNYPFRSISRAAPGVDPWEREHTLRSRDEFVRKVCRASRQRPVLVKFGNTNCTQCMLFEMIGSVKEFAQNPAHPGVDVYKVWWGFRPDDSFAGRLRDPERLDDPVKAEGVRSSPTFAVYRDGRRVVCGDAFPDPSGSDPDIDACLKKDVAGAAGAATCEPAAAVR